MGWETRDWAKWTEQERRRFYGDSAPAFARPGSSRPPTFLRRFRSAFWLAGTIGGLIAIAYLLPLVRDYSPRVRETPYSAWGLTTPGLPDPWATPNVRYGWRVEPPAIDVPLPRALTDGYRGYTALCTIRRQTSAGWFCDDVAFLPPGQPYIAMPADSSETAAPCSQLVAPGGKPFPCPGGWKS